jgi:hypothetical protein
MLVRPYRPKLPAVALLVGLLAVIILIVVLPDVDLLDTAFPRNTSPSALYSHSHSNSQLVLSSTSIWLVLALSPSFDLKTRELSDHTLVESLQVLHHSFRC